MPAIGLVIRSNRQICWKLNENWWQNDAIAFSKNSATRFQSTTNRPFNYYDDIKNQLVVGFKKQIVIECVFGIDSNTVIMEHNM